MLVYIVISMWFFKMKKKDFVVVEEEGRGRREGIIDFEKYFWGD